MIDMVTTIAALIITIMIIVGIHELSHCMVAKLCGVKVIRFSIGFGKVLKRWHDKNGTEYAISAIPLGGYVKMLDTRENKITKREQSFAFDKQPVLKRLLIIVVGPLSNVFLAFLIYWLLFTIGFNTFIPIIGQVTPNSIAKNAGLTANQVIVSVDHSKTSDWGDVTLALFSRLGDTGTIQMTTKENNKINTHILNIDEWHVGQEQLDPLFSLGIVPKKPNIPAIIGSFSLLTYGNAKAKLKIDDQILSINNIPIEGFSSLAKFIAAHPDSTFTFKIKRDQNFLEIPIKIGYKRNLILTKTGYLGILPKKLLPENFIIHNQFPVPIAFIKGLHKITTMIYFNVMAIEKLIIGKISIRFFAGPLTLVETAGVAFNLGFTIFLFFLAFLSLSLGVINLLPIPTLDGGHLLYLVIEAIRKKPVSVRAQILAYRLGLIVIILLMLQTILNDFMRYFS